MLCNCMFFLLSNAQPSSRLQHMVPRNQKFSLAAVAEGIVQMSKVLISGPAKRQKQASQILERCVQDEEKMVAEGDEKEMEGNSEQGAPGSAIAGSPAPGAGAPLPQKRARARQGTERSLSA